jgi:argininosuccinate lyase
MKRKIVGICAGVLRDPRCGIGAKNGESVSTRSWSTGTSFTASRSAGLIAKIGAIGGALRAGRSRNDLVVADFKLYLVDHLLEIASLTTDLVSVFNVQSEKLAKTIAPGFTHLQHAQPIVFGHELAKHSQALLRDVDRIGDWLVRNNFSPLVLCNFI